MLRIYTSIGAIFVFMPCPMGRHGRGKNRCARAWVCKCGARRFASARPHSKAWPLEVGCKDLSGYPHRCLPPGRFGSTRRSFDDTGSHEARVEMGSYFAAADVGFLILRTFF